MMCLLLGVGTMLKVIYIIGIDEKDIGGIVITTHIKFDQNNNEDFIIIIISKFT